MAVILLEISVGKCFITVYLYSVTATVIGYVYTLKASYCTCNIAIITLVTISIYYGNYVITGFFVSSFTYVSCLVSIYLYLCMGFSAITRTHPGDNMDE